jgi:6-phosphofructokinase 1
MAQGKIKRIAVMCSGGDAPGMNAAVRAVVRAGQYHNLDVFGVVRGYDGLIDGNFERMESRSVSNIINRGGTFLKSARSDRFRTVEGRRTAYETLSAYEIDAIIAVGGNGTFTGGQVFFDEYGIPFIGIPGTIDNDLYGTDYTIGFDTACNTVIDAVDKIRDTADSHDRLFFIEVMGRDAGFIALHAGIAGGVEAILLPEAQMDIEDLVRQLNKGAKKKKSSSMVIVAEGNVNGGAMDVARKVNERFSYYDTKVTIIGHLQRGGSPTCADRVLASRLGVAAVDSLAQVNSLREDGKSTEHRDHIMVGIVNDKLVHVPLRDTFTKHKEINEDLRTLAGILAM